MNRLAPLIARHSVRTGPVRLDSIGTATEGSSPTDDLRVFTTAFLGGLVFFGTFLA